MSVYDWKDVGGEEDAVSSLDVTDEAGSTIITICVDHEYDFVEISTDQIDLNLDRSPPGVADPTVEAQRTRALLIVREVLVSALIELDRLAAMP